jgi:hypothetical protein
MDLEELGETPTNGGTSQGMAAGTSSGGTEKIRGDGEKPTSSRNEKGGEAENMDVEMAADVSSNGDIEMTVGAEDTASGEARSGSQKDVGMADPVHLEAQGVDPLPLVLPPIDPMEVECLLKSLGDDVALQR